VSAKQKKKNSCKLPSFIKVNYYYNYYYIIFYFLWLYSPAQAMASSFTRFRDHTQRRATVGRTPLEEWSARRRDLYLTKQNTHNKHPCPRWDFFCTIVDRFDLFDLLVVRVTNMGQNILLPLPKEGMLWIFPAGKIRRLRSGANPRSWVPEASTQTTRPPKPLIGILSPDRPARSQSLYQLSYPAHAH
jgi:hypothetical protein